MQIADMGFQDRRIVTRFDIDLPLKLEVEDLQRKVVEEIKAKLRNISEHGMSLVLDKSIPIPSVAILTLDLPYPYHSLTIRTRVIWLHPSRGRNKFNCGLYFTDIPDNINTLREFMGQLPPSMLRKNFAFDKVVYLSDTNAEGNVYFANYFQWQGMAREEFYRRNFPLEIWASGIKLITCDASIRYKKEAILFDEVLIDVSIDNLKKMSLDLVFTYTRKGDGAVLATGKQKIAFGDPSGNLIPIPNQIRDIAQYFLIHKSEKGKDNE
ncbi:MAG: thioesterase family protein [bacterium]